MDFRRNAKHDFAGKGTLWFLANFLASFNIIINGFMKGSFDFSNAITMKADVIIYTRDMANKALVFGVQFNAGVAALILKDINHGRKLQLESLIIKPACVLHLDDNPGSHQ